MIEIEKGVPIPHKQPGPRAERVYPFPSMHIGDSFFVPKEDGEPLTIRQKRLNNAGSSYGKRHGGKFITRQVDGGVRIWRIE